MRVSTLIFSGLAGFAAAAPYYPFPLSDGFPKPNAAQLKQIQVLAGGSLPGGSLATQLTADATVTVQLLALNEIFEVAFFTDLLYNITNNVPGYTSFPSSTSRDYVINAITAIQNVSMSFFDFLRLFSRCVLISFFFSKKNCIT